MITVPSLVFLVLEGTGTLTLKNYPLRTCCEEFANFFLENVISFCRNTLPEGKKTSQYLSLAGYLCNHCICFHIVFLLNYKLETLLKVPACLGKSGEEKLSYFGQNIKKRAGASLGVSSRIKMKETWGRSSGQRSFLHSFRPQHDHTYHS